MLSLLSAIIYLFVLSLWSLIPVVHLPPQIATALSGLGGYVKYANNFFPMTTLFQVIAASFILEGFFITWYLINGVINKVNHSG